MTETIRIERDWNAPGIRSLAGTLQFRDYGSYIEDLVRGTTVVIADAYLDARTRETAGALKAISAQALVNMPVTEHGGLVALLYLNHAGPRQWPPEDLSLIREFAERTRTAMERLRVSEALRESEARLREANETLEAKISQRTAELTLASEALRQSQKMEAIGQLTGGIAHDFNNLLAAIGGSVEVIKRRLEMGRTDGLERFITAALTSTQRAAALTHRLLAFSRLQSLDPQPSDLRKLISGMSDLLHRSLGESIELETIYSGDLWQTLTDSNQLENAILNLAINARDAMPEGGRLTIEAQNTVSRRELRQGSGRRGTGRLRRHQCVGYRLGHASGGPRESLRPLLHHQADRPGHRPRPLDDLRLREAERRPRADLQRSGSGHVSEAVSASRHGARMRRSRRRRPIRCWNAAWARESWSSKMSRTSAISSSSC